jgi:hypothetical protein
MSKPGKELPIATPAEPLSKAEWNFDDIPESELRACVYWEYARESGFLRDLKNRCQSPETRQMTNAQAWKWVGFDIEKVQALGPVNEVFLRGFFFSPTEDRSEGRHPDAPPINGRFPCPWQDLPADERACRSKIREERESIPLVPFERAFGFFARELANHIERQQRENTHGPKTPVPVPVSEKLFFAGGAEIGLFQIEWGSYTNEELRAGFGRWVAANRPPKSPPPDHRGEKPRDLRVALDRLGMMRLRHRYGWREMATRCPEARRAFADYEWSKERQKAEKMFQKLFPTFPKEKPRSWPQARAS